MTAQRPLSIPTGRSCSRWGWVGAPRQQDPTCSCPMCTGARRDAEARRRAKDNDE